MRDQQGFTMVEIVVAIGILAIIFTIGLLMSMDVYRGYSRRSERDTLVSVLQRARSRAIANINQNQWGACYDGHDYHIFSGPSYGSAITIDTIEGNPAVTITDTSATPRLLCSNGGIVFTQLTGDTTAQTITVMQEPITSTISVNTEGRIDW